MKSFAVENKQNPVKEMHYRYIKQNAILSQMSLIHSPLHNDNLFPPVTQIFLSVIIQQMRVAVTHVSGI